MLPFVAQGAAQSLEDVAILSALLSNLNSPPSFGQPQEHIHGDVRINIETALKMYELTRKPRAEYIQVASHIISYII